MSHQQSRESVVKEFEKISFCAEHEICGEAKNVQSKWLKDALTAHALASTQKFADEVLALIKRRLPDPMTDHEKEKYHCESSVLFWGEKLIEAVKEKAHGLKVTDV